MEYTRAKEDDTHSQTSGRSEDGDRRVTRTDPGSDASVASSHTMPDPYGEEPGPHHSQVDMLTSIKKQIYLEICLQFGSMYL